MDDVHSAAGGQPVQIWNSSGVFSSLQQRVNLPRQTASDNPTPVAGLYLTIMLSKLFRRSSSISTLRVVRPSEESWTTATHTEVGWRGLIIFRLTTSSAKRQIHTCLTTRRGQHSSITTKMLWRRVYDNEPCLAPSSGSEGFQTKDVSDGYSLVTSRRGGESVPNLVSPPVNLAC